MDTQDNLQKMQVELKQSRHGNPAVDSINSCVVELINEVRNLRDYIISRDKCRDVRRFEAIQMEIDGYLDGAPDASAASKLAGRISAILKPMDAPAEPSNGPN
jgi:hypothetical protein